jgi:hypothetical protein
MATTTSRAEPTFFKRPADFRKWLHKHHASATELPVGYWKTSSGEPAWRDQASGLNPTPLQPAVG